MSKTLEKIQGLADVGDILISEHGYDELSNDNLTAREIVGGVKSAVLIEDYPNYPKGAAVLVLQKDSSGILFMRFGEYPKDMIDRQF